MQIASLEFAHLAFPGRAGELQRRKAIPSLVAELGDRYATYHEFLRAALAEFGKPPVAADYPSVSAYYEACAAVQEIVKAELLLRNCKAYRKRGRSLDATLEQDGVPLVNSDWQLVSTE